VTARCARRYHRAWVPETDFAPLDFFQAARAWELKTFVTETWVLRFAGTILSYKIMEKEFDRDSKGTDGPGAA
jgi:hypothetical protein